MVYSHASATGYGGHIVEHDNLIANGIWSNDKAAQSSTWRELQVVKVVLESFQTKLRNARVHWCTDNQNVVKIVQHGSSKPALQARALASFHCVLVIMYELHLNGFQENRMSLHTIIAIWWITMTGC